jgi:hypothetical protein
MKVFRKKSFQATLFDVCCCCDIFLWNSSGKNWGGIQFQIFSSGILIFLDGHNWCTERPKKYNSSGMEIPLDWTPFQWNFWSPNGPLIFLVFYYDEKYVVSILEF